MTDDPLRETIEAARALVDAGAPILPDTGPMPGCCAYCLADVEEHPFADMGEPHDEDSADVAVEGAGIGLGGWAVPGPHEADCLWDRLRRAMDGR